MTRPPSRNAHHTTPDQLLALARTTWDTIGGGGDRLVTPRSNAFICQPNLCDSMCCRAPYTASISIWDIEALEREEHDAAQFLAAGSSSAPHPATVLGDRPSHKQEERRSSLWWLDQPSNERCTFLEIDGGCAVYDARPNGCSQYPHTLLFAPVNSPKLVARHSDIEPLDLAVRIAAGVTDGAAVYVPLIVRDTACPGFTGPPIGRPAYRRLLLDLWAWGACFDSNRPCDRHPHPSA